MKVQYRFVNGDLVELDVAQEYGEVLADLDRLERNNNQTETRRHVSLDMMIQDQGVQFADVAEMHQRLVLESTETIWDGLLPQQKRLIYAIFFENRSIVSIAREEGVNEAAIRNRLRKAYARMKKNQIRRASCRERV